MNEIKALENLTNGVLINFRTGFWTASARLDKKLLGKNIPKEIIRAMQDMFVDKTLIKDIMTVQRQAKYYVLNSSLPFPIDAVYFIPAEKVGEVNENLKEFNNEINNRVEILISNYDKLKRKFQKKYPEYYNAVSNKYPSKERLRDRFYMQWNFFQIGIPGKEMMEINPAEYKKQIERTKAMVKEMEEMTITLIGNEILLRIEKLQKQCETGEGLHGKTIGSIERLIKKWEELWKPHVDDKKIKTTINRLKREMKKITIERLKSNQEFRLEIGNKLSSMMKKIEKIPNVQTKRKIDI